MINNKGSVTLISIYICSFVLLLSLLTKSIFMENYYYYKQINKPYNIELIENAIVKNIYNDYKNVKFNSKRVSYVGKIKNNETNQDIIYDLKLRIDNDNFIYRIVYDKECTKILEFIDKTSTISN